MTSSFTRPPIAEGPSTTETNGRVTSSASGTRASVETIGLGGLSP